MFKLSVSNPFAAFRKDESGSVAVETAILFPSLLFCLFLMMNIFDAYRAKSTSEKAAFAISDMLSRETVSITDDYLDGIHAVFEEISTVRSSHDLTVTHVYWSTVSEDYEMHWSHRNGGRAGITDSEFEDMKENLPIMVDGESLIVVETTAAYTPPIMGGWSGSAGGNSALNLDIETFVFTRPRFAPQLAWSDA